MEGWWREVKDEAGSKEKETRLKTRHFAQFFIFLPHWAKVVFNNVFLLPTHSVFVSLWMNEALVLVVVSIVFKRRYEERILTA